MNPRSGLLLPPDPGLRAISEGLYELVAEAPIISPHGHVPIARLRDDRQYADPLEFLIDGDHYIIRLLHASGIDVPAAAGRSNESARELWRTFCAASPLFAGTSVGTWLRLTLSTLFGIEQDLDVLDSDALFDDISASLASAEFRPRTLLQQFGVTVLATTDDPLDDLHQHREVRELSPIRILPTPRVDAYQDPTRPDWAEGVERLLGGASGGYRAYRDALAARRAHFVDHGAVSVDLGIETAMTLELSEPEAARLFDEIRRGTAGVDEARAFAAHMIVETARMSVEDGLVMTLHVGSLRNHDRADFVVHGPDRGHDIPTATEFTESLRPLLERFGNHPDLHLVVFTLDAGAAARELAPLAGYYPALYVGAPWWFLDAPDAMTRFRESVTETIGFSRTSGFIDDTRALPSIPARHEVARRRDAGYLATLVADERISLRQAERIIVESVGDQPRRVFRL